MRTQPKRYRRRETFEAIRYTGATRDRILRLWVDDDDGRGIWWADRGYWILRDSDGRLFGITDAEFRAQYEEVEG